MLYTLNSLRVLARLFRSWGAFWDGQVTPRDRALANELAFFVLIPLGVFLHEAGHTVATWQVGGQVVEFQWRVFWGYIRPAGEFTPAQYWWIALSGNLVSILLGLLPIPLLLRAPERIWGELLYAFIKHQLFYSLIWYPAISFLGFGGDWLAIYDFSVAPYAQVTLSVHVLLLYSLWRLDKSDRAVGWRIGRDADDLATLHKLEAAVQAQPASAAPLTKLAYFFHQMGEHRLSQRYLGRGEKLSPNDSELKVTEALIAFNRKQFRRARAAAEAALASGLSPEARGRMHSVLAYVHMDYGQRAEALAQFDSALRSMPEEHILYYWRAVVKRSMGRRDEARYDFERAMLLAPDDLSRTRAQQDWESLK